MERGEPVPGLGLEVGALVQQQPHHVPLAPLSRHVQRRDVVLQKIFRKLQKYLIVFVGWGRVLGLGSRSIQYVALLAYSAGSGPISPKFQ